jgi:hypothetical protein
VDEFHGQPVCQGDLHMVKVKLDFQRHPESGGIFQNRASNKSVFAVLERLPNIVSWIWRAFTPIPM